MRKPCSLSLCLTVLSLTASAQSFNLDAQSGSSAASLPPASYGGPAGSTGLWNSVHSSLAQGSFVTVDGVPTTMAIEMPIGCPNGPHACDDPSTSGPDALLLDDYHWCDGSFSGWEFFNLQDGSYVVYTVVFHPCGSTSPQRVRVFGSAEVDQDVLGTWSGSYVQGQNYTRHTVTVTNGSLYLTVRTIQTGCCGDLNAVQIVKVDDPAPVSIPQCYGDGGGTACPCGNSGWSGHGCQNSSGSGGAALYTTGTTSPDTVVLNAWGEMPSAISVFLQGNATVGPLSFGDGLRCAGAS